MASCLQDLWSQKYVLRQVSWLGNSRIDSEANKGNMWFCAVKKGNSTLTTASCIYKRNTANMDGGSIYAQVGILLAIFINNLIFCCLLDTLIFLVMLVNTQR